MAPNAVAWWTMIATVAAAVAAIIYAGLTLWLLFTTRRAAQASTLVQLVTNNRHLVEYAATDDSLLALTRGAAKGDFTSKQYAYVSLIAGQVMCAFECQKLGVLSQELFAGIQLALVPMLRSEPVRAAILEISSTHPELQGLIKDWIREAGIPNPEARGTLPAAHLNREGQA